MILFFDPTFCLGMDGVKKTVTAVFCIALYKMMQTFDIMLKKIHGPSVNQFDGV